MRVLAIVPVYNEEKTVGQVAAVLAGHPKIDAAVVVSDGSHDATVEQASKAGADVLDLSSNVGKSAAIGIALDHYPSSDYVLLMDADLRGVTSAHVDALLDPVLAGNADMSVGLLDGSGAWINLSGQRVMRRQDLVESGDLASLGYGLELAITRHMRGRHIAACTLQGVRHPKKEQKHGPISGTVERVRMYAEMASYQTGVSQPTLALAGILAIAAIVDATRR